MLRTKSEFVDDVFDGNNGTTITVKYTGIWCDYYRNIMGYECDDDGYIEEYVKKRILKRFFIKFNWFFRNEETGKIEYRFEDEIEPDTLHDWVLNNLSDPVEEDEIFTMNGKQYTFDEMIKFIESILIDIEDIK